MPSHMRIYVETVLDPATLDSGPWSRKAAVARGETEGDGSWSRRMTSDPVASTGPWQRRMVDGVWTGPSREWEAQLWQLALPDFDGLTAGSAAGVLGATGALPTGWSYDVDGVTITVDEATHDANGVECITVTVEIAEAGEASIYFPDFQATDPEAEWTTYLYVASSENTDMETVSFGLDEYDIGEGALDFNSQAVANGLNTFVRTTAVETALVRGRIFFASAVPSSFTMTFAAKNV